MTHTTTPQGTPIPAPVGVTLRSGESINLSTMIVDRPRKWKITGLPLHLEGRLDRNDPNALRSAFALMACAWTPDACHQYVTVCGQHPRG